jgi:hypothetical protein
MVQSRILEQVIDLENKSAIYDDPSDLKEKFCAWGDSEAG